MCSIPAVATGLPSRNLGAYRNPLTISRATSFKLGWVDSETVGFTTKPSSSTVKDSVTLPFARFFIASMGTTAACR